MFDYGPLVLGESKGQNTDFVDESAAAVEHTPDCVA